MANKIAWGVAVIVTLTFLVGGAQNMYVAALNPTPTTLSFEDFKKDPGRAKWVRLTDCRLFLPEGFYESLKKGGKGVAKAYIPIRGVDDEVGSPIAAILATTDHNLIFDCQLVVQNRAPQDLQRLIEGNPERFFPEREIQGLIRFGLDDVDQSRDKMAARRKTLIENFAIIEHNREPSAGFGIVSLFLGVLGVAVLVFFYFKERRA